MTGNSGLEGVVIGSLGISSIIGAQLTYCGYEIDDLQKMLSSKRSFICYGDKLPNAEELTSFKKL